MSYILEAIKKADLKRKIGTVPDVHSDHDLHLSEPNHRLVWPYILALVLFFNAGLLMWWLKPWNVSQEKDRFMPEMVEAIARSPVSIPETSPDQVVPELSADSMAQIPKEVPSVPGVLPPKPQPLLPTASPDQDVITETGQSLPRTTLPERIGSVTQSIVKRAEAPQIPEIKPLQEAPGAMATANLSPINQSLEANPFTLDSDSPGGDGNATQRMAAGPLAEAQTGLDSMGGAEEDGNETEIDAADGEAEESRAVFDINTVPFLYQLPEIIQQDIPEIEISFHSYRFRPSSRLVRINGRIMREGQNITKELKLEKIVPSGVVLLFDHKRFRVGL